MEFSPIKGPEGNIEYLVHIQKVMDTGNIVNFDKSIIADVVAKAHANLDKEDA